LALPSALGRAWMLQEQLASTNSYTPTLTRLLHAYSYTPLTRLLCKRRTVASKGVSRRELPVSRHELDSRAACWPKPPPPARVSGPTLTRLLLHAYSYTPTLTRLLLHAYSYRPTLTRLLLHAYSYTPTLVCMLTKPLSAC
jgi:hypothetical protein